MIIKIVESYNLGKVISPGMIMILMINISFISLRIPLKVQQVAYVGQGSGSWDREEVIAHKGYRCRVPWCSANPSDGGLLWVGSSLFGASHLRYVGMGLGRPQFHPNRWFLYAFFLVKYKPFIRKR